MSTQDFTTDVSLFITDYASYSDGSQFEFGKWWQLSDYDDADDLLEAVREHFENADKERPIDSPREEIMVTDKDNLPDEFYSEAMSHSDFEKIYEYLDIVADIEDKDEQEWVELHNQWSRNTGANDEIYVNDEDFFNEQFSDIMEAVRATHFGQYSFSDEFVEYNGDGNLTSICKTRVMDEIDTGAILDHIIENKQMYSL